MIQKERLEEITRLIRQNGRVMVTDLSRRFNVTPETIRRDLEKLEDEKLVIRIYGGAVTRPENGSGKTSFRKREETNIEEKRRIARLAAAQVPLNASIGCDASSTSMEFLRMLRQRSDILVVTNSAVAISETEQYEFGILSTGGYVNRQTLSLQGGTAKNMIRDYHLEQIFISCHGLDLAGGIFDSHNLEAEMKQAMMERGGRICLLADHSKFGRMGLIRIAQLSQINTLITDRLPSREWRELLDENGVELIYGEE